MRDVQTHLDTAISCNPQLVPRDADNLALEARRIVLIRLVSQVREEVKVLARLGSLFLNVLLTGPYTVEGRAATEFAAKVLRREARSIDGRWLTARSRREHTSNCDSARLTLTDSPFCSAAVSLPFASVSVEALSSGRPMCRCSSSIWSWVGITPPVATPPIGACVCIVGVLSIVEERDGGEVGERYSSGAVFSQGEVEEAEVGEIRQGRARV